MFMSQIFHVEYVFYYFADVPCRVCVSEVSCIRCFMWSTYIVNMADISCEVRVLLYGRCFMWVHVMQGGKETVGIACGVHFLVGIACGGMGLVGWIKLQVSFAKETYKRDAIL